MRNPVRLAFRLALVLAMPAFVGCGGNDDTASGPAPSVTATTPSSPLQLTASVTKAVYGSGETVPVTVTVTNTSSQPATINTPGGGIQPSDPVTATVTQGTTILWDKDYGTGGGANIGTITFAPGETKHYEFRWNQTTNQGSRVSTGTYSLLVAYASLVNTTGSSTGFLQPVPLPIVIR